MQGGDREAARWLVERPQQRGDLRLWDVVELRPQLSTGAVHVGNKLLDELCGRLPHVSQ